MCNIDELKQALADKTQELANLAPSRPQFLVEDEDEYQDQLELLWAKRELIDEIDSIKEQIRVLEIPVNVPNIARTAYPRPSM